MRNLTMKRKNKIFNQCTKDSHILCDISYLLKNSAAEYSFFRAYILSKTGMMKVTKNLVNVVGSLWSSFSITKSYVQAFAMTSPSTLPLFAYACILVDPLLLSANVIIECPHVNLMVENVIQIKSLKILIFEDFDILIDQKRYENISIYNLYKTLIGAKPLGNRFDKIIDLESMTELDI